VTNASTIVYGEEQKIPYFYVPSQCDCVITSGTISCKSFISRSQQCPEHPLRQA